MSQYITRRTFYTFFFRFCHTRYLARKVAEKGYSPFVVIRPENVASQSLYKKLGFERLYQMVRATFLPATWKELDETSVEVVIDEKGPSTQETTEILNGVDKTTSIHQSNAD